jgi:hypothetical protein
LPSSDQWFRFYDFLHDDGFAENCNSGQTAATREKLNLGLFASDSSPELNTKKLEDSPSFPSVTYTDSSDQRFRSYGILCIDVAAEFCFWTEQRQNGSLVSILGLAETPDVSNTISIDNSLRFPMVY